MYVPKDLAEVADRVRRGETPRSSVRTLLSWFGFYKRGSTIVYRVIAGLASVHIETRPDFRSVPLDGEVDFVARTDHKEKRETARARPEGETLAPVMEGDHEIASELSYQVGSLEAANRPLVSVRPDASILEALTIMMSRDFSQLPVMQSEREVKGIVTWGMIAEGAILRPGVTVVRECMNPAEIVSAEESLFEAMRRIVVHQYVLVRAYDNRIQGIVTATDLAEEFRQMTEPFLLLGEIENHIRALLDGRFSQAELSAVRDPADAQREIKEVWDLNFGEYARLLEGPANWKQSQLAIDRAIFIERLHTVRRIRNDVMHFDPDGVAPGDLGALRDFARFLKTLAGLTGSGRK